jgi:hypothetical protein
MRRAVIVTFVLLALLGLASQLFLPGFLEGKIEQRMEKGGGSAQAELSAFPALRLLTRHGSSLQLTGSDLDFDLTTEARVFKDLDGFDDVSIDLTSSRAGPVELDSVQMERRGEGEPYDVALDGRVSPREFASYVGERFGGPLGGFFGGIAGGTFLAAQPVPFTARAQLASTDGRVTVVSSQGTVAGLPVGPLAELVATAVVAQLS